MSNTQQMVTLTEIYNDFVNRPDAFEIGTAAFDRGDDCRAQKPREYLVPAGYKLMTDDFGQKIIVDPTGRECDIVNWRSKPWLVSAIAITMMRPVEEEKTERP